MRDRAATGVSTAASSAAASAALSARTRSVLRDVDRAALVRADADRAVALPDLHIEAQLTRVDTSRSTALTVQVEPSPEAPTCFTQTSKPTVAFPSGRCSRQRIAALRSIIAIMPGVERTLMPIVPPTSVRS